MAVSVFLASFSAFVFSAFADDTSQNIHLICDKFLQKTSSFTQEDYSSYFDPSFTLKTSFEELQGLFSSMYLELGSCVSHTLTPQKIPGNFTIKLTTEKGIEVSFLLAVDQNSKLFSYLILDEVSNPHITLQSWEDVGKAMKELDATGTHGATLKTSDGKTHLSYSEKTIFAIASTFKLYVLGALQTLIMNEKQHTWDEKLAIREDWKSLPSGNMQNLPAGTLVSLREYATQMISISDNTATDHLLYFLGREAVQKMLKPMNNEHSDLNIPFMSTLEVFKLKWAIDPQETKRYIDSDGPTKLKILNEISAVPIEAVGKNGMPLELPNNIADIEWFGTTNDTCNAILWLAEQNNSEVRKVLSTNVLLMNDVGTEGSHWAYAGFKGGSETGVASMTYLLESKKGNRACLSMSWNNTAKEVSMFSFLDVVKKTLKYAESQIP
jgi:hypothetical protein